MSKNKLPVSRLDGDAARDNAVNFGRNPDSPDRTRLCLAFVRGDCWRIPMKYATAREAYENADNVVKFDGGDLDKFADSIPVGAPVFSRRPGDDAGAWHVFIACGWFDPGPNKRKVRLFRSVDIKATGEVDACTIHAFVNRWGHEILGWTKDLNGVRLRLGD